ncbi:MAG: hypothetical protein LBU15_00740 [Rickettsiales bacterium]|jgi:hypothetical protein|nr:hypothetical protein [Rickettsiales bacterium]
MSKLLKNYSENNRTGSVGNMANGKYKNQKKGKLVEPPRLDVGLIIDRKERQ